MISGYVVGSEEVVASLQKAIFVARADLKQTIARLTLTLLRKVKGDKLSGGVLNVRTGRLRRSTNEQIQELPGEIFGKVGTNVSYGRVHEYGFSGAENVKAHLRTIKIAFGKELAEPRTFLVKAHTRQVNIPERSFLRSALRDLETTIKQDIAASVHRSVKL